MNLKAIVISTIFIVIQLNVFSQNDPVCFDYDPAGNRISRTICVPSYPAQLSEHSNELTQEEEKPKDSYSLDIGNHIIKIFPNPTEGKFVLSVSNLEQGQQVAIKLFTMNGSLLYEKVTESSETEVDISQRENGSYILHVLIGGDRTVWKIIKQ